MLCIELNKDLRLFFTLSDRFSFQRKDFSHTCAAKDVLEFSTIQISAPLGKGAKRRKARRK